MRDLRGSEQENKEFGFSDPLVDVKPTKDNVRSPQREEPAPAWARATFQIVNVVTGCVAASVAKQMVVSSKLSPPQDADRVPSWFSNRYKAEFMLQQTLRNTFRDTVTLVGASALWYGGRAAMRTIRSTDDQLNLIMPGALSGWLVGSRFVPNYSLVRSMAFTVLGGLVGSFTFQQEKLGQDRLYQEQRRLEKKYTGMQEEQLHKELHPQLLRRLLKLEEQENLDKIRVQIADAHKKDKRDGWDALLGTAPWLPPPSESTDQAESQS